MAEEYVTKVEFTEAINDLEKKMTDGFSKLKEQLEQIQHSINLNQHTDMEKYDQRYCLQSRSTQDAISRVGTPEFRKACHPIVAEWTDTPDGRIKLGCVIDQHLANKRDNATKWINFVKLIGGILIALLLAYGGTSIVKSNQQTQQVLIKAVEHLGE